jgi:hypothetical protein
MLGRKAYKPLFLLSFPLSFPPGSLGIIETENGGKTEKYGDKVSPLKYRAGLLIKIA